VLGQGLLRPLEEREKRGIDDVYLLRVEQLYPFPLKALITSFALQERRDGLVPGRAQEHGRLGFVEPYLEWVLNHMGAKHKRPRYVGRPARPRPRPA
jgi:2-oxoglutarate dehydrogenase E1 component